MRIVARQDFKGQTIVEYSLLLGIVIAVLLILTPMVKRSTQGMVKVVADELGYQRNAESQVEGGLIFTNVQTVIDRQQHKQEWYSNSLHRTQTSYQDNVQTTTQSASDLGPVGE